MGGPGRRNEFEEIYVTYLKNVQKAGVFPYFYDKRTCVVQRSGRRYKFFVFNVLTTILIFIKQSYLVIESVQNFDPEQGAHPDLMFRVMWFLGSLFLSSMFAIHIFYATQVSTFIPLWINTEERIMSLAASSALWNVPKSASSPKTPSSWFGPPAAEVKQLKSKKRLLNLALKFYLMMWIGSQIFMGSLYAWNPQFYPFLYSVLGSNEKIQNLLSNPLKILLIIVLGLFEINFIGLAMVNMAGFDLLLGFVSLSLKTCLRKLVQISGQNFDLKLTQNSSTNSGGKVVNFYFQLQILVQFINRAFSTVIFVHLIVVFLMIPFFIYGIEHYSISPQTTMFFFWCIFFQVIRLASIWMPLALVMTESKLTLKKLKFFLSGVQVSGNGSGGSGSGKSSSVDTMSLRKLRACQILIFTSGGINKISCSYVMKFVFFATSYMVIFIG